MALRFSHLAEEAAAASRADFVVRYPNPVLLALDSLRDDVHPTATPAGPTVELRTAAPGKAGEPEGDGTAGACELTRRSGGAGERDPEVVFVAGKLPEVSVGRDRKCDVVISDASVSRLHARFHAAGEAWSIEDLAARNGTTVNGTPVPSGGRVELPEGCRIRFGESATYLFHTAAGFHATLRGENPRAER